MTPATRHVEVSTASNGSPFAPVPRRERTVGFRKMMYDITMNVVAPAAVSVAKVVPSRRKAKRRSRRRMRRRSLSEMAARVMVIGLDGVPPGLVFDRLRDDVPSLGALAKRGTSGVLASCDPPIT